MNDRTCDICGKEFSKPSAMKAHKRWSHGGDTHGSAAMKAELAEAKAELAGYRALETKVAGLVKQVGQLSVKPSMSAPGAAKVADSGDPGGGALLVAVLVGLTLWANRAQLGAALSGESPVKALMHKE